MTESEKSKNNWRAFAQGLQQGIEAGCKGISELGRAIKAMNYCMKHELKLLTPADTRPDRRRTQAILREANKIVRGRKKMNLA